MNTQTMNIQNIPERLVIQGLTARGQVFRPRNWAERLCDCMATMGPGRKENFSPYVYVSYLSGVKSLIVERGLWENNPQGYNFLASFAHDNGLKVSEEQKDGGCTAVAVGQ